MGPSALYFFAARGRGKKADVGICLLSGRAEDGLGEGGEDREGARENQGDYGGDELRGLDVMLEGGGSTLDPSGLGNYVFRLSVTLA